MSLEFPERYHSVAKLSQTSSQSCSLTEMLSKFTETEALEGRIYNCNYCNSEHERTHTPTHTQNTHKELMSKFSAVGFL